MEDIAPGLLEILGDAFRDAYREDKEVARLLAKVEGGTATGKDLDAYAERTGTLLSEALHENVSSDVLPDGRMYYNIADRVLTPVLEETYDLVSGTAEDVYRALNEAAGIHIRAQTAEINRSRIDGIVEVACQRDADGEVVRYDDVSRTVERSAVNYAQSVATDSVRANADFHYRAGLSPKVERTASAGACKWCLDLADTYEYSEVKRAGSDVWRRHANCNCTIEYIPVNGARRMMPNYARRSTPDAEPDKIEERIATQTESLFPRQRTGSLSAEEYARAVDLWNRLPEYQGLTGAEKEHVYEEFDNWLTAEEKSSSTVHKAIGDYQYYAVNKGHNEYKIYNRESIDRNWLDEIMAEAIGSDWKDYESS